MCEGLVCGRKRRTGVAEGVGRGMRSRPRSCGARRAPGRNGFFSSCSESQHSSPRAAATKRHELGVFKQKCVLSEIRLSAEPTEEDASSPLPASGVPSFSLLPLHSPSLPYMVLCVHVPVFLLFRGHRPLDLGPTLNAVDSILRSFT